MSHKKPEAPPSEPQVVSVQVTSLSDKALSAAMERVCALLEEFWPQIFPTFRKAFSNWCDENPEGDPSKFRYTVPASIRLRPLCGNIGVQAKLRWGLAKTAASAETSVSDQPELPGLKDGAE